jgi:hypothetical protein
MTDHNEVADVLDGAADIIERDGWCQGALERDGAVCAIGALTMAMRPTVARDRAFAALARRLGGDSVARWNDAPERTKQEVLDLFRTSGRCRGRQ